MIYFIIIVIEKKFQKKYVENFAKEIPAAFSKGIHEAISGGIQRRFIKKFFRENF